MHRLPKNTCLLTLFLVFTSASESLAQEKGGGGVPFNGYVTDIEGKPLRTVKIYVDDPNFYALSDRKGRFGLTDVKPTDTLHIRYRRNDFAVPVAGRKSLKIRLFYPNAEAEESSDLVDLGYGYVKRRETANVTNGISGAVIARTGQTNLLKALQGLVPGLMINESRNETSLNIRGQSSIMGGTTPLFVIDGTIVDTLDDVNVLSVDYVEVLKQASIYGSRGANGAIVVHLKKE